MELKPEAFKGIMFKVKRSEKILKKNWEKSRVNAKKIK